MRLRNGDIYSLNGDEVYPISPFLTLPFKGTALTPDQILFNEQIFELRVSVEWVFGMLLSQFAYLYYRKNQKL